MATPLLTDHPAHANLTARAVDLRSQSIAAMLEDEPQRARDFTLEAAGLELDYSRQLVDRETLAALLQLAEQAGVPEGIRALLDGEHVNNTEDRPALHSLLRASSPTGPASLYDEVDATRERMAQLANAFNTGQRTGYTGKVITDVVNIGIGGSDLGPRLVTGALPAFQQGVSCHYVANVDPADIGAVLAPLDPATTGFLICSKSFRTEETLANSLAARQWMLDAGATVGDLDRHFLAVTTNLTAAADFGIPEQNCLPMWDWVGGRYSVWSAVGTSCAIALGWENFAQFLAGAQAMDAHFRDAEPRSNMPLLMALLEVWNSNYLGAGNHAVLPYDQGLARLPDFLQQLTMESNGKRVASDGRPLSYATAPVMWGSAGTMGQHSFHQMLHQGTLLCPADFVLPLGTHTGQTGQHRRLVANCLAQARAFLVGRNEGQARESLLQRGVDAQRAAELAPHLAMPGNRPASMITMDSLTPFTLGALLALYEHRTFCSARLWGINPFDQWGVELGKEIGADILQRLSGEGGPTMDASTERLLARCGA